MPRLKEGDVLAPWTIVRYIDKGGNGEVYEATDESRTRGALKLLSNADTGKVPYERFAREVNVLKDLGLRPGIVPLLDANVPEQPQRGEKLWYVMPLASPLREHLTGASVSEVVAAVREIARVLASLCDETGIVHRDIKPANLYWLDGPAVGDFGLVEMPDAQSLTENGRIPGAFGFIADELFRDPDDSGPPVDVYSLAKTLWVLLVEGADFPPQGPLRADQGPATLVRALTIERAEELDRILEAATTWPAERLTMERLANELDAWLTAPERARPDEALAEAVAAAKRSMEPIFVARDASARRAELFAAAAERIRTEAEDLFVSMQVVDPTAEVGSYAIGTMGNLLELTQSLGDPMVVETWHYGAKIIRDYQGAHRRLIVAFCLQLDENGIAYPNGLVIEGVEEFHSGDGVLKQLSGDPAPIDSVALDRSIVDVVDGARKALPDALRTFTEAVE